MHTNTRLTLGSTEVTLLVDSMGIFPFPADRLFPSVSEAEWQQMRNRYPAAFSEPNVLTARIACYLLRQPKRTILVDTGMGLAQEQVGSGFQGRLLEELKHQGISPDEIDTVFLTHLDPDHVGGAVQGSGESAIPAFASARYIVHRADWELCIQPPETGKRSRFVAEQVLPLHRAGVLTVVEEGIELGDGIRATPTPGHTPGHMSVWVEDAGRCLLLAGDAFYRPLQVPGPHHLFPLDMDQATARETRRLLLQSVQQKKAVLSACHFPDPALGYVRQDGSEAYWTAFPEILPIPRE